MSAGFCEGLFFFLVPPAVVGVLGLLVEDFRGDVSRPSLLLGGRGPFFGDFEALFRGEAVVLDRRGDSGASVVFLGVDVPDFRLGLLVDDLRGVVGRLSDATSRRLVFRGDLETLFRGDGRGDSGAVVWVAPLASGSKLVVERRPLFLRGDLPSSCARAESEGGKAKGISRDDLFLGLSGGAGKARRSSSSSGAGRASIFSGSFSFISTPRGSQCMSASLRRMKYNNTAAINQTKPPMTATYPARARTQSTDSQSWDRSPTNNMKQKKEFNTCTPIMG